MADRTPMERAVYWGSGHGTHVGFLLVGRRSAAACRSLTAKEPFVFVTCDVPRDTRYVYTSCDSPTGTVRYTSEA